MRTIIQRIGHRLGINMSYFIKGSFWLGIDQIASVVFGMVLTVIFANLLPKETYGVYRYVLSLFGVLTITTLPNMNIAITTVAARGSYIPLKKALKERITYGSLGALVALGFGIFYLGGGQAVMGGSFLVAAAFLPFMDSLNLYSGILKGKKDFKKYTFFSILERTLSIAIVIAALLVSKNVVLILLAFFLSHVFPRFFILSWIMKQFPQEGKENKDEDVISYGKHLSVIQFLNFAVNYADNIIVFNLLGPAALAVYSIAMTPISKIQQGFSVISEVALPKFSVIPSHLVRKKITQAAIGLSFVVAGGMVIYFFLIPILFSVFFPQYTESIKYSQILGISFAGLPFSLIYTFFQAKAMKREIYVYNLTLRVVQLGLVLVLIPLYGLWGAVWARVAFQGFSTFLVLFLFRRAEKTTLQINDRELVS